MKLIVVLFCIVASATADTIRGAGIFRMRGLDPSAFSFTLEYQTSGESSRAKGPQSNIGAVRQIGRIKVNFGSSTAHEFEYPFYITQFPDSSSHSLIGFYIADGYPHVLKIDTWSADKKFQLFESFRSPDAILTGKVTG